MALFARDAGLSRLPGGDDCDGIDDAGDDEMKLENLEFLVYSLTGGSHEIWTTAKNIWHAMGQNFPEVTESMISDALESLTKRDLLRKEIDDGQTYYLRTRVWKALGLPKRDRYGNLGEDDDE